MKRILIDLHDAVSETISAVNSTDFFSCQRERDDTAGQLARKRIHGVDACAWAQMADIRDRIAMRCAQFEYDPRLKRSHNAHQWGKIIVIGGTVMRRQANVVDDWRLGIMVQRSDGFQVDLG